MKTVQKVAQVSPKNGGNGPAKKRFVRRMRRWRFSFVWLTFLLVMVVGGGWALWSHSSNQQRAWPSGPVRTGNRAPEIHLSTAQGGTFNLTEHQGHVLLLSFLQTRPDTVANASRNQAVVLVSMNQQYSARGLEGVVVDESTFITGMPTEASALLNVTYDWQLGPISLLNDSSQMVLQRYGVEHLPVTFLIGASGVVMERWDGFVLAAQVALALQSLYQ